MLFITISDIQPNLKGNTKVLQSGATHTIFSDSDTELQNNVNTSTATALDTSNILPPESESKKSAGPDATPQNARKNRRRRNRKKARKLMQIQQPVGGEDDVLVAVSKIFKNSTDSEACMETNKTSEIEASLFNNDNNSAGQEKQSDEIEDTGDDFGVDFTADFDSFPELHGAPRVGDVLVYKVIN